MTTIRGRGLTATLSALVAIAALAAPIAAAGPRPAGYSPAMTILVNQGCVVISAAPNNTADMVVSQWRSGADPDIDTPLATATATAPIDPPRQVCLKPIQTGDQIRLAQPSTGPSAKLTRTVPEIILTVDDAADTVTTTSPNGMGVVIRTWVAGLKGGLDFSLAGDPVETQTYNDDGQELARGDVVVATDDGTFGVSLVAVRIGRTVTVKPGSSQVTLQGQPGTTLSATLKTATGTVRAKASCKTTRSGKVDELLPCTTTWKKAGSPVKAKVGNQVVTVDGSAAVRASTAANAEAAFYGNPISLTARCPKNGTWLLTANGSFVQSGRTPSNGTIDIQIAQNRTDTTVARLGCATAKGFGQVYPVRILPAP